MRPKKDRVVQVLAWSSYAFAAIGGAAVAVSFVGAVIAAILGLFPDWVAAVAILVGFAAMGTDLIVDGTPNRTALVTAILLPSVARAAPGKLSGTVTHLCNEAMTAVNDTLGPLLGTTSALVVAAIAIVSAALIARRVIIGGKPTAKVPAAAVAVKQSVKP